MVYEILHQPASQPACKLKEVRFRTGCEVKIEWSGSTWKHNKRFWKAYGLGQSRIYEVVQESKIPVIYIAEPGWTYREDRAQRNKESLVTQEKSLSILEDLNFYWKK